jgi:hypothetical protein
MAGALAVLRHLPPGANITNTRYPPPPKPKHETAPRTLGTTPPGEMPRPPIAGPKDLAEQFGRRAQDIIARHNAQTVDDVAALRDKYATPTLGNRRPWDLVEMMGQCIDPTDSHLYCASQQMHVLQMLDAMENEGAATDDFVLVALVHDLGKVLLLTDEAPENIVCFNRPLATGAAGCGWDNCVFQWNHDEWAYMRLKDHLPDGLAWLVRYHSVLPASCAEYMDARDRAYVERYLKPFYRYDHMTKSPLNVPQRRISHYRAVIERALPATLPF